MTNPTIFEDRVKEYEPAVYSILHKALASVRKDLYRNGKKPQIRLVSQIGTETKQLKLIESNDAFAKKTRLTPSTIDVLLKLRGLGVVDRDELQRPLPDPLTEDALRRPRPLGKW